MQNRHFLFTREKEGRKKNQAFGDGTPGMENASSFYSHKGGDKVDKCCFLLR
jgi:hypothetical protein